MRLTATTRTTEAALDFESALGLDYARSWVHRVADLKPPSAGILRRALAVYLRHLDTLAPDQRAAEGRAVTAACNPLRRAQEAQEAATARLAGAFEGTDPLPWREVITDPAVAAMVAAINARADAVVEQILTERTRHRGRTRQARDHTSNSTSKGA